MNLFIFSCLSSDINLFIFSSLTSGINLFIFNCLTPNFCFPKIISFASRRERVRLSSRILISPGKMMNCYLRDTNKFLRCRTLCTSIRKCRFSTKGIKQTRFLLFEVLEIPQLWGTFEVRKFAEYKWSYGIRNFSVVEKVLRLRICS